MVETKNGLSTEFLSHPGETLLELMEQYGVSQKELSIRIETSEKHINEIIKGKKSITVSFAKKLENVFKPEASFWINRQHIYDVKLETIKTIENISKEEKEICKEFPIKELVSLGYISDTRNDVEKVLMLRKFSCTSNLLYVLDVLNYLLPDISFKKDKTNSKYNPYKLYSWLRMCQIETEYNQNPNTFEINKLKSSLHTLKKLSRLNNFEDINVKVTSLLFDCGINFKIVRNFEGLSVQGYIKTINNNVSLCTTIKWHSEDVFWFTLFHEIGHLIHKRNGRAFVDMEEDEDAANAFARDFLIKPSSYKKLLGNITKENILKCSNENDVCPAIVVGRLRKEKIIEPNQYCELIRHIDWKN